MKKSKVRKKVKSDPIVKKFEYVVKTKWEPWEVNIPSEAKASPSKTNDETLAEFVCTKKGKLAMEKAGDALIATAQRLADIRSYQGEGDCPICEVKNQSRETKSLCWWCEQILAYSSAINPVIFSEKKRRIVKRFC